MKEFEEHKEMERLFMLMDWKINIVKISILLGGRQDGRRLGDLVSSGPSNLAEYLSNHSDHPPKSRGTLFNWPLNLAGYLSNHFENPRNQPEV